MKVLIENAYIIGKSFTGSACGYITVEPPYITYVGAERPEGVFDSVIDASGCIAMPGLVNTHTHIPMVLFRGYAEDMPLKSWLTERIFPAEDKLDNDIVRAGTNMGIAELLAGGVTSFSDMYFFCDTIAEAVAESGIKANISRSITNFDDPNIDTYRFREAKELFEKYNGTHDGRIMIEMAVHAEYTNNAAVVAKLADYTASVGARIQMHLSETESEHRECIERHGMTPAEFFESCGCFDIPALCAHCVWVSESDIDILARRGVSVAHNPSSNLKLGSGIAPVQKMLSRGVNVTIGTDGCASNNNQDMFTELHLASLLAKGSTLDPAAFPTDEIIKAATVNGAKAQGRNDTGVLEAGFRADIILVDASAPHMRPMYDAAVGIVQSARAADVRMTMADGRILYRDGSYPTLDIDKINYELDKAVERYR